MSSIMMSDKAFSKSLMIQMKHGSKEDRLSKLNLSIEVQTSTAPIQKKIMQVQITDQEDLFFLYTLRLDEEDFQSLKNSQGLLVDFPSFPQKLTELLNLCLQEETKEVPKFILQLMIMDNHAMMNVVETNPFKHLIHLSLKMLPGNDNAVKNFLADCLRSCKEKHENLLTKSTSTEASLKSSLRSTEEALTVKTQELVRVKLEWDSKLNELEAKNAQHVTEEKELSMQNQSSLQQRYQQEKKDLEQAHMKIVKQLEARVYELDTQNKDLTETKFVNDASIRDLKSRLSIMEDEAVRMRQDVQQLRKDNSDVESEKHRQEKSVSQLHTQIAVLEQQLADKEALLTKSTELLKAEEQQKKLMEVDGSSTKARNTQLETSLKTLSDEILKANEIIRKLQSENKNFHAKLKLRSQVALEQERILKEKEGHVEKMQSSNRQLQNELDTHKREVDNLTMKMGNIEKELNEAQKKNASNENVISWLNKQLDQVQVSRVRTQPPVTSHPSTLSSAGATRNSTAQSLGHSMTPIMADNPESMTKIPQPVYKSTPITEEPDTTKENGPVVDAKYLQRSTGTAPLRNRNQQVFIDPCLPQGKTRISKEIINAPHNPKTLANAYFPQSK